MLDAHPLRERSVRDVFAELDLVKSLNDPYICFFPFGSIIIPKFRSFKFDDTVRITDPHNQNGIWD